MHGPQMQYSAGNSIDSLSVHAAGRLVLQATAIVQVHECYDVNTAHYSLTYCSLGQHKVQERHDSLTEHNLWSLQGAWIQNKPKNAMMLLQTVLSLVVAARCSPLCCAVPGGVVLAGAL